jgi:hypothetical protein
MSMVKKQLKDALGNGNLYDFISSNGHYFTKDELICIIKNLDYAIYTTYGEDQCTTVEQNSIDALNDYSFFDED